MSKYLYKALSSTSRPLQALRQSCSTVSMVAAKKCSNAAVEKAREQPLVQPVAARIADLDFKVTSSNGDHPFERLGSVDRG